MGRAKLRSNPAMERRVVWCPCLRSEDIRSIYEHLWESMVAAAEAILHDCAEGEDIAQEGMVRVAQRYCDLRDTGSVKSWARSITRRLALNRLRESSRRRKRQELATEDAQLPADPEELATARERLERLARALDALPTPAARVLRMRIVEGRSLRDIALLEHVPPGTIMSRLARAKERLQRTMVQPLVERSPQPCGPQGRLFGTVRATVSEVPVDHNGRNRANADLPRAGRGVGVRHGKD